MGGWDLFRVEGSSRECRACRRSARGVVVGGVVRVTVPPQQTPQRRTSPRRKVAHLRGRALSVARPPLSGMPRIRSFGSSVDGSLARSLHSLSWNPTLRSSSIACRTKAHLRFWCRFAEASVEGSARFHELWFSIRLNFETSETL